MLNVYEDLGETSRRQILAELRTGPKTVTDLVTATGLKQPNVSNHLARMRQKEIVRANKVGRQVFYSLASPDVEAVVQSAFAAPVEAPAELDTEQLAKAYAKAAVQGDEQTCSDILDTAYRSSLPLLDIYQYILAPAMALVGTWYKVDAIDEGQEHLASAITERMMARTSQVTGPTRRHGKVALLGCAEGSFHVIGLRMLSDYLRYAGWRTLFLGANVPSKSFLSAIDQHRPSMVLVSVGAADGVQNTLSLLRDLAAKRQSVRQRYVVGVGGTAVSSEKEAFMKAGADFSAPDLRTFALEYLPEIERAGQIPSTSN